MCCPLSTRSPVSGSRNAVARPPSPGRASSTSTRAPASASAVAALKPAPAAPITMTSVDTVGSLAPEGLPCRGPQPDAQRPEPVLDEDRQRDAGAGGSGHADDLGEHVVAAPLDALQNLEVDAAHDFR